MSDSQSSYRQIFKATSIFGGVRVITIIVGIIRTKILAVLLGPAGMGISGLLTSGLSLVAGLTGFGLETSAIKNIASANAKDDKDTVGKVVAVFRRLVWITGLLGAAVTFMFSGILSKITFGNYEYTVAFILLSVILLFDQLSSGKGVVLQAFRKIQYLAKANISTSISILLLSVPIYYIMGIKGIVPVLILGSIMGLVISWYYGRKVFVKKADINYKDIVRVGKDMLKMGFVLSLSGLITTGISYLMRIFISNNGGVEDVGLYSSGSIIITQYVGLVFSAMSADYYPRLSEIARDNHEASVLINQQSAVGVLIVAPILVFMLFFMNWIIVIIYTSEFLSVAGMISWMALGMYFKVVSWAIAFLFLAKGLAKNFFWNELVASFYMLGFNMIGYSIAGLDGLGFSFMVGYFLYMIQVYLLVRKKFRFSFSHNFFKIFVFQFAIGVISFLLVKNIYGYFFYIVGAFLFAVSVFFSLFEINKKINLLGLLKDRFNK